MIGPLSNPALVERQVIGVFDKKLLKIFAEGLKNLNLKFAWIVNSEDGLDEISPYAITNVIQLKDGQISEIKIDPNALNNLDIKFAWIVNSEDGLDEISPYAKTNVIQLKNGEISEIIIDPTVLNINAEKFDNLVGDDANYNASKMIEIFKGKDNDFSKAVCLNAAAGLIVNEKYSEFLDAYNYSREFILSGKPYLHLEKLQNV